MGKLNLYAMNAPTYIHHAPCNLRHSANISTLIIFKPHRSANCLQSSRRAILPSSSSFTSSQRIPALGMSVRRHRSMLASVCPLRVRVPPSRARRGTMWPGRVKSWGREVGEASARAVNARSCAEIPVLVPNDDWSQRTDKYKIVLFLRRTSFVIHCDHIRRSVSFLVCGKHRRYFQLIQAVSGQGNTYISANQEIKYKHSLEI